MIEYTMLILLGICIGGLVAFLFAPSVWHRAVRLTTRRLEATMPMSLSEIEADKDLLRASYAVKIRRLEAGLNAARDKSANQLVEISRHQMEIAELCRQMTKLNADLEERRNAAAVFETTIRKRLPELEQLVASANGALDERGANLEDLQQKLERREEMLRQVRRSTVQQQEELARLRAVLDRQGADKSGRFKRRPMEWGLDEYRSEYDRLNVEMSRMREQLAKASEVEAQYIPTLKREMQQLAEQIITSAPAQESVSRDWREHETQNHQQERHKPPRGAPRGQRQTPLVTAKPWPDEAQKEQVPTPIVRTTKLESPEPQTMPPAPAQKEPEQAEAKPDVPSARPPARPALSDLLANMGKDETDEPQASAPVTALASETVPGAPVAAAEKNSAEVESTKSETNEMESEDSASLPLPVQQDSVNSRLDQVFREFLDGPPSMDSTDTATATASADTEEPPQQDTEKNEAESAESNTQTLVDRLRLVQERQTG